MQAVAGAKVRRWLVFLAAGGVLMWLWVAAPARSADQFTIDPSPASFGSVVTDTAGNGYVAWEHAGTGAAADVPMFCKLAPAARRCEHPIALALPGRGMGPEANALAPFPILGPGSTVWVVASRYVLDDTLIWTSSDGGRTFGAPWEIPYVVSCPPTVCPYAASFSYTGLGSVDDMLPVTLPGLATYDGQLYTTRKGQPFVYWFESSYNPDLGFNFDVTDEIAGGPPGATEFTFGNPGGGSIGGSALGTTSVGDVVEAYWLLTTPPTLAYYSYHAHDKHRISSQAAWRGPTVLGDGYLPRLADGAAGLFLLSEDSAHGASQPTTVDVRKYDTATHAFGGRTQLAVNPGGAADLFSGGGLGENYDSGELAAVWPEFGNGSSPLMRLYLSTDGGAHFSPAQDVATVGHGYAIADNARVAIADHGTGFVTFQDTRGLQVADLYPLGAAYRTLHSNNGKTVRISITCPAPKGHCKVTIKLTRAHAGKLAGGRFTIAAGATRLLKLRLGPLAIALLRSHHGRLGAILTLLVHPPGAITHTTTAHVTIRG